MPSPSESSQTPEPTNWGSRLIALAERFTALADTVPQEPLSGKDLWAPPPPAHRSLIYEKACRDHRLRYDQCIGEAGSALIALCNDGVIATDERLQAVVAAYELQSWGGFVRTPADLFVIYAGGPRIELRNATGGVEEYESVGDGIPPQICPVRGRVMSHETRQLVGLTPPVDPDRCKRYASVCSQVAESIPQLPPQDSNVSDVKPKEKRKREGYLAPALMLLKKNPHLSVEQIAMQVGCNASTLYRNEMFKSARDQYQIGDPPPRGYKRAAKGKNCGGDVEAYTEPEE